jgi:hypothetical protein
VYRLIRGPRYGVSALNIDGWTGALEVALEPTLQALREDPLVGFCDDPLTSRWSYSLSLFQDHLPLALLYRVDSYNRMIELEEVLVDKPQY